MDTGKVHCDEIICNLTIVVCQAANAIVNSMNYLLEDVIMAFYIKYEYDNAVR
jgi:phage-related holin